MTVEAKTLIKALYGRAPRYSYWNGCSGGALQGLLLPHRYPDEFDGIIAGDPANVRRNAWALWLAVQTFKDPEAAIPPGKYPMIHRAVLDACDVNDGLKDGLIDNPASCHVDFSVLQCTGADGPDCLTARQVQSAQTIISPAATAAGQVVFPRLEPGTELRWDRLAGGPRPADPALNSTIRCSHSAHHQLERRTGFVLSWCRAWGIAAAGKVPTRSTRSTSLNAGSRGEKPRPGSLPPIAPQAPSIVPARCAGTPKSHATMARAASTMRRTSVAALRDATEWDPKGG